MASATYAINIASPLWSSKDCSSSKRRITRSPFLSLKPKTLDPNALKPSSLALNKTHLLLLPRRVEGLGTRNSRSVVVRCEASNDGGTGRVFFQFWIFLFSLFVLFGWWVSMFWVGISISVGWKINETWLGCVESWLGRPESNILDYGTPILKSTVSIITLIMIKLF